jgi:hypothetical protein
MSWADPHRFEIVPNHLSGGILRQVECVILEVKNVLGSHRETAPNPFVDTGTRENFDNSLVMKIATIS